MGDAFTAKYRRGATGWIGRIDDDRASVVAAGGSLDAARRALVAELAEATRAYRGHLVIHDEIDVPPLAGKAVAAASEARRRAAHAAAESKRLTEDAARRLLAAGLSLRDAAYVLGMSHARVRQLTQGEGR